MMVNKLTFDGNVGADVETGLKRNGEACANLRVCYTDRGRTGNGPEIPVWVTVICFGRVVEIAQRIRKGDNVVIEGRLTTRVASDTGNEVTEIVAHSIGIVNRPQAVFPTTGQRRVHYPHHGEANR